MQTVSLLLCIMIAVAAADDAAARAADGAADAAKAADAGAADAGAARGADAGDAGAARGADAGDAGAARGADAGDAGAARGADAGDAGADRAAHAADAHANRAAHVPACHDGWNEFEGRCFQYVPRPLSWASAEKNCKNVKSHLASVHNHHEYQFIQKMIRSITQANDEAWIGGSDCQQKDTWLWSDGKVFFWTFWCAGQRNSAGCLQMNHGGENCWDEEQCSSKLPSVCAYNL